MNGQSAMQRIYFIAHMINVYLDAGIFDYKHYYALYLSVKCFVLHSSYILLLLVSGINEEKKTEVSVKHQRQPITACSCAMRAIDLYLTFCQFN